MSDDLKSLRERLNDVDRRLVDALAERQSVVDQVAKVKSDASQVVRDPAREEALLTQVVEHGATTGLDRFFVTRVFREILDHSLRKQHARLAGDGEPDARRASVVVGYQGGEGSYSHMAATRHFGALEAEVAYRGFDSFRAVAEAVAAGGLNYGVLPIENTTAGSINESYDLLASMNLALVGEEVQRVEQCLIGLETVPLSHIRRVFSHPQAIAQCSQFLDTLSECHVEAFKDTALAVGKIKEDRDLSQAAIASEEAARLYGLPILRKDIANQKQNYTRMVVVAKEARPVDARIPAKTSLILATRHEHGALAACLNLLDRHDLNLTKLESRPRPNTPWEYLFYVDFEGNVEDEKVKNALRDMAANTSYLKVLGSYPARTVAEARPASPRPSNVGSAVSPAPPIEAPPVDRAALEKKPYKLASRINRSADTVVRVGEAQIGGAGPVVIAGPCAVESREQILAAAQKVKEAGGALLRGGCFKPRTSPYSFQGLGYEGLDLLEAAGREVGLPIITEVMHPADVKPVAVKADVLQIGARNMQNFALLKEIGAVDRPVMLKRGLNATIDEWLQAAEYILAHGNQQVILCERGIRTFETATRNTLDLAAVPVVRERTHLPIVVDPSHAVGVRRWIAPMALAAVAAGAHGIMVEIHPDPKSALSDGPQALEFDEFESLMQRL